MLGLCPGSPGVGRRASMATPGAEAPLTAPDFSGMGGHGVPNEAPAFAWVVVVAAVLLWWLWPWIARLRGDPSEAAFLAPGDMGGRRLAHAPLAAGELGEVTSARFQPPADEGDGIAEAGAGRLESDLDFNLMSEFTGTFSAASEHLKKALDMPPAGEAYTASISALKLLVEILDRLFQSMGSAEDIAKVSKLRESGEAFRRDFGAHRLGESMRGLLQTAGFERHEGEGGAVWVFPYEDALARLRGLTVRLCLLKSAELQKLRGPGRFLHVDNLAVVPKLESALFVDLIDLYKGRGKFGGDAESRPSARERNLEADIRIKLNERRAARQLEPLALHEGLAGICRSLAEAQRTRARKDADDLYPRRRIAGQVRAALAKLPLPPGFTVAHLHWSSTELPRLFGMGSSRGGASGVGLGTELADGDEAAEIMANEAVGFWSARQTADVFWPAASICGVGAALDYTVNKGFGVALVIGFEAQEGDEELTAQLQEGLRRRVALKPVDKPKEPAVKFTPAKTLGNRITGFRDLNARPKPPGGG